MMDMPTGASTHLAERVDTEQPRGGQKYPDGFADPNGYSRSDTFVNSETTKTATESLARRRQKLYDNEMLAKQ